MNWSTRTHSREGKIDEELRKWERTIVGKRRLVRRIYCIGECFFGGFFLCATAGQSGRCRTSSYARVIAAQPEVCQQAEDAGTRQD